MQTIVCDSEFHRIGHDLLGPIVHRYLLGLHQYISYFDDGDTTFLFCARAGVRIEKLYEAFTESKLASSSHKDMFWISRVSVSKGVFTKAKPKAAELIRREYANVPISQLIQGIFRNNPNILNQIDLSREEYLAHGNVFAGWIEGPTPAAELMREYFMKCGEDFDAYLKNLTKPRKRVVLIDSGWQGTTQSLLSSAYPELTWRGLYFGRTCIPGEFDSSIIDKVVGILFERDRYDATVPESAFVRHRHIIETLLEPNAPSIEEIPGGYCHEAALKSINANKDEVPTKEQDPLFLAVLAYLRGEGRAVSISEIMSRHSVAMKEMERIILHPTRDEANALFCKDRSADFGRKTVVPVLIKSASGMGADERIRRALWQEGQVALEYEGGFATDLQLRLSGRISPAKYFDPYENKRLPKYDKLPTVAVITRTKNRPLLLKRAADSVLRQTFGNYIWVIVNDGGDSQPIETIIRTSSIDRRRIILINNSESYGMEAASNIGIVNCRSDYITIHDDDDSWEPNFLEQAVSYLEASSHQHYGGVITHTMYVSEEIRNGAVIELDRKPYMNWVRNVQLTEMAAGNFFAPISFLYRRSVWEDIGGYNEGLPVLGDWYFNLEFLLRKDIGVLPNVLANYHHRDQNEQTAYSNSVFSGISKHEEYASVARNEFIRRNANRFPGATAAILGYFASDLRRNAANNTVERIFINEQSPANTDFDRADKYWCVFYINQALGQKRQLFSLSSSSRQNLISLSPTADWDEIEEVLKVRQPIIPIPSDFDEYEYLTKNPDVATECELGNIASGYQHYLTFGRREKRHRPSK